MELLPQELLAAMAPDERGPVLTELLGTIFVDERAELLGPMLPELLGRMLPGERAALIEAFRSTPRAL